MDDSLDNLTTFDPEFEPSAAELKEGQFLGENRNYRLEKNLGVGGMGEVWLAAEIRAGKEIRKVVVKTLRPDRRGNEGAQEKALKQFQLIQSLNHQNICPIYVIEKDPACGYLIVMGYAGGGSFADWFAGKPKPLAEVCRVLRPIADALDFAHSKGVIHRDVKPSNMMFTSDKTPWLIDFGIAANLRTATQATTGQFSQSGTDSYMAPEQKNGELQTAQTDEYSLAMVALEFLAGSLSPLAFSRLAPAIQGILGKALSEKPAGRYAKCRAFIDALSSIRKDCGSPSAAGTVAKTAIDQIVEAERLAAEAKQRAEEEALQKRIQDLDELVAEEYQSGRYAETINHLNELLKLRPKHPNTQYLLERSREKLGIQKEAERKAREEAERKAREVAERKAREVAERNAREVAERNAREEVERKAREEKENKFWLLLNIIFGLGLGIIIFIMLLFL
ncbi:MAG: protein kinase [Thermoguttaceae bacterium]|nr:protein kinase [Thermoguttaceae bacterium]